jgi:hypothetical protein
MSLGGGHSKEQGENIGNQPKAATNPVTWRNPARHRKEAEIAQRGCPHPLWASNRLLSREEGTTKKVITVVEDGYLRKYK